MWIWRRTTWLRDHPRVTDAIFGALIVVMSLISQLTEHAAGLHAPSVVGVLVTLGATVPIVWRRQAPIPVLLVVLVFQGLSEGFHYAGAGWSGVLIALYTVGTQRSGAVLRRMATVLLPILMAFIIWGVVRGDAPWQAIISTPVMFFVSLILGDNMRRRRERVAELAERAERAERERELLAHQHVQEERTRIARELHDVVAHSVSLMVIQAAAARRQLSVDPTQAKRALAIVESTGRTAMDEMRRILGVLRDGQGEPSLVPAPALTDLQSLMATATDLPLAVSSNGNLNGLPPGVELSAYRIVQESLTNVRRHAGPVRKVEVTVQRDAAQLVVEVDDDGRGASAVQHSGGFGILGMRERVHAFGGELVAGPRHGGGWRVRAVFPMRSA
jgi:signal transduction histidine kinase